MRVFTRRAKAAGATFTFGTNNAGAGDLGGNVGVVGVDRVGDFAERAHGLTSIWQGFSPPGSSDRWPS